MRIIASFAISLDGKIHHPAEPEKNLGSETDFAEYIALLEKSSAVLIGGNTFRHHPQRRRAKSGWTPKAYLLSTRKDWDIDLIRNGNIWTKFNPNDTDQKAIVEYLEKQEVKTLMLEGGRTCGWFIEAGLLTDLFVTICPVLIGDNNAPTLAIFDSAKSSKISLLKQSHKILSSGEIMVHYQLQYLGE